ncbi:RNA polymerase sigma factor [Pleomorphovibrio marinus]|uniref:RNA polymerase sigma factor n=1 Tax=Pleomorphovibrio marinus TaxID=2164132 RepID=UPI000E0BBEF8|nr:RNA polymerase sigma factor [Pleomorphovibrio marinus]
MQDFRSLSDLELWQLVQKENQKAFSFLYNTYTTDLLRYGVKLGAEEALIEDVIHDIFVKLWSCKKGICINKSIKYYLFSSFRRELIRSLKRGKREEERLHDHMAETWEQSFQEVLIENQITLESHAKLKCALEALSNRQKEAIYLKFIEELSYEEISDIMGIQVPSLYNLVFKSLNYLKNHLLQNNFYLKMILFIVIIKITI